MALDFANVTEELRSSNSFTMRKVSTKHCQMMTVEVLPKLGIYFYKVPNCTKELFALIHAAAGLAHAVRVRFDPIDREKLTVIVRY